MKKSLQITGVRTIFSIAKPIVVFEVGNHQAIVRNPKQALTDLQNSGRGLRVSANALANGVEGLNPVDREAFIEALLSCQGAVLTGDIQAYKAGDEYTVSAGHPALTNSEHPMFGKVKEGSKLKAETDGVWIEGFLSIPVTPQERLMQNSARELAVVMAQMFGFAGNAPQGTGAVGIGAGNSGAFGEDTPEVEGAVPSATADEAFGTAKGN